MRVAVVHSGNLYGGTERVLETLARSRELGVDVDPYFALCFEGKLSKNLRERGTHLQLLGDVRLTRPHLILRARRRLAALLRAQPVDAVIVQSPWALAIFGPVVRRLRLPLILWVHDALSGTTWIERLGARYPPDLLICNSSFSQRAARTVFPATASEVVYCPHTFDEPGSDRGSRRREFGTPEKAVVLVNVARMEPYKGQRLLIDALARLNTTALWECWIIGGAQRPSEEQYAHSLREAVRAHGLDARVRLLGPRDDVAELLADADIFCHPAQGAEPFGLAIVEALHAGLPVVASGRGGPEEILTDACGMLVPSADVKALAEALRLLMADADRRQRAASAGPARARELCEPVSRLTDLTRALNRLVLRAAA